MQDYRGKRASIEALASVVDAVGGRTTVIVDSGVRRGGDVVTALAIDCNREEISRPIACLGCHSLAELSRDRLELMQTPHLALAM